jgi:hypothetical protein
MNTLTRTLLNPLLTATLGLGLLAATPVQAERRIVDSRWWDGAHGHGRYYPVPGYRVPRAPVHGYPVFWGGVSYSFYDGIWYSGGTGGYLVVRPPLGIVVNDLPTFATVLTIGALSYYYVNGTYYRPITVNGSQAYEVVQAPVASGQPAATPTNPPRLFVYPRQGQSDDKQAGDEYACHRWASERSGFDPTARATGATTASSGANESGAPRSEEQARSDYQRAQAACLEGRGYTVR